MRFLSLMGILACAAIAQAQQVQQAAGGSSPAAPRPPALPTESERLRAARVAAMKTDERIAYYEKMLKEHAGDAKAEAGLAAAFIQKMRETTDFAFLDRATAVVNQILKADPKSYDGLVRLLAEIENSPGH